LHITLARSGESHGGQYESGGSAMNCNGSAAKHPAPTPTPLGEGEIPASGWQAGQRTGLHRTASGELRPGFFQAFDADWLWRAQFLGKKAHPQFFKQPAKLLQTLVHHPFALGHQAPVALF